jgi:hypothetical protein
MKAACSLAAVGLLALAVAGCEAQKSSNPLSPSVAGPIAGVDITAPVVLDPAQGHKFKDTEQPIRLTVQNAATTGVRPLHYTFEVGTDNKFTTKLYSRSGIQPGAGGKTSVQLDALQIGRSYFWRVRAEDGANTGPFTTASFEIQQRPSVDPPVAVSPVNNASIGSTTATLVVSNAHFVGPVGPLTYQFQVAHDQAFVSLAHAASIPETPGQTRYTVALASNIRYFWRARATDGTTASDWSAIQSFMTPAAPSPGPDPNPGPAPGGPCNSSDPLNIVSCERAKYGHMSNGQIVGFLTSTAQSLNRNHIAQGPFGLLRKGGGNNCGGYSCDIICSGQGNAQKQWDVLGDSDGAQRPSWNGPETVPHIRVDTCSIK